MPNKRIAISQKRQTTKGLDETTKTSAYVPYILVVMLLLLMLALPVKAELSFSPEEKDYINNAKVLKVVSIDGIAPLYYLDSKGEIKGIGVSFLSKISEMTGLVFEYYLYESIAESLKSDFDIYLNAARSYAHGDMVLSQPYLESETILFFNSSLDPNQLDNKRHAAIKGGTLPAGVKAENTIYYDNREATLNAVEKGKADYGYGNAYSLAYYALQNGYKNVVTIPKGKEKREYCIGVPKENEVLLSIINKTIASLDENQMQTLILDVASRVERKITFSMIINTYGKEIFGVVFMVIAVLLLSVYSNVRANKRLKIENQKHRLLSNISNECLFEYAVNSGYLELSERFNETIDVQGKEGEVINLLLDALDTLNNDEAEENVSTIRLPLSDGNIGVFRIIYLNIYDKSKKPHYIIGKLIDISEEIKEKEELLNKAQTDGLTGLYNAATVKGLITASINNKDKNKTDALIIIDCDKFKEINDTFGHLKGDSALTSRDCMKLRVNGKHYK